MRLPSALDERTPEAFDSSAEERPGVPMEQRPQPAPGAHWDEPTRQHSDVPVLTHAARRDLTPVYGTAIPPRGLSGMLRRVAYRIPEERASHWMLLLLADRVDVAEHRLASRPLPLVFGAAALAGALAFAAARKRSRF